MVVNSYEMAGAQKCWLPESLLLASHWSVWDSNHQYVGNTDLKQVKNQEILDFGITWIGGHHLQYLWYLPTSSCWNSRVDCAKWFPDKVSTSPVFQMWTINHVHFQLHLISVWFRRVLTWIYKDSFTSRYPQNIKYLTNTTILIPRGWFVDTNFDDNYWYSPIYWSKIGPYICQTLGGKVYGWINKF